jgi:hypothetical protein
MSLGYTFRSAGRMVPLTQFGYSTQGKSGSLRHDPSLTSNNDETLPRDSQNGRQETT